MALDLALPSANSWYFFSPEAHLWLFQMLQLGCCSSPRSASVFTTPSTFRTVLILHSSITSHLLSCPSLFSQTWAQADLQVWITFSVRVVVWFIKPCWGFLVSLMGTKFKFFSSFQSRSCFRLWNITCHFVLQTIFFRKL